MQKQQGDMCLETVCELPDGVRRIEERPLALGEVTGHAHRVECADLCEFYELDGVLFVKNKIKTRVTHEEHGPIVIEPGIWKVGIVREYDHFADMERQVKD